MNITERQSIGFCVALEAIDDIANHSLVELRDVKSCPGECEVWFPTSIHRELFLIRLHDFLSEKGAKELFGSNLSCLSFLEECGAEPSPLGGTTKIREAVDQTRTWLNTESSVDLWLPTLNVRAILIVSREFLLSIASNQSKHNLSRLTGICRHIEEKLKSGGYHVEPGLVPLALEEFHEHLNGNYFLYYATWVTELLNNIRWALQDCLFPQYQASYHEFPDDPLGRYEYIIPSDVGTGVARDWYWRLMNNIRRGPNLKRFRGAHYLKSLSSLEREWS